MESLQELLDTKYGCVIQECREDEEIQANFLSKEASLHILETTANFTVIAILTEI